MPNIELISNEYNKICNKKIYELISYTSFYFEEMNWSLTNIKYYYKNIKFMLMIYFIMFFDFILFLIFGLGILFIFF